MSSLDDEIERLLRHLCGQLGFCLPASKRRELATRSQWEAREFALEVLRAEGFENPEFETKWSKVIAENFEKHFGRSVVLAKEFEL
jgi:hypothetical protein